MINTLIKPMLNTHLDSVLDIESRVQPFPWSRGNFADSLKSGYQAYVATHNDLVVGFYVAIFAPDIAHLLLIATAPEFQNQGVGKQLLNHCQQLAKDKKYDSIILEVRASNQSATAFYKQSGYQYLTTKPNYYQSLSHVREDAYVMIKDLNVDKGLEC